MGEQPVRWTINVDRETDINLRTHLAQKGMKKGDLSKFVEDAVKWRLLRQTMSEIQDNFKTLSEEESDELIEEALAWARSPDGFASDANAKDDF